MTSVVPPPDFEQSYVKKSMLLLSVGLGVIS